jgi:hypothetical protein
LRQVDDTLDERSLDLRFVGDGIVLDPGVEFRDALLVLASRKVFEDLVDARVALEVVLLVFADLAGLAVDEVVANLLARLGVDGNEIPFLVLGVDIALVVGEELGLRALELPDLAGLAVDEPIADDVPGLGVDGNVVAVLVGDVGVAVIVDELLGLGTCDQRLRDVATVEPDLRLDRLLLLGERSFRLVVEAVLLVRLVGARVGVVAVAVAVVVRLVGLVSDLGRVDRLGHFHNPRCTPRCGGELTCG